MQKDKLASVLENELTASLERQLKKQDGTTPHNLAEAMRYSLLSPGKRIRPRLMLASAQMLGLTPAQVLPAALSLEMIHCFTLIHDDLPCMDDDDYRRGRLSNHKVYGEAVALLAGDALIAAAYDSFMETPLQADRIVAGLKRLNWAMGPRGVCGGQAEESLLNEHSTLGDLEKMHAMKTGALFLAAMIIPADFSALYESENGPDKFDTLYGFAHTLGVAFQIADDLEDRTSPEKNPHLDNSNILRYLSPGEAKGRASTQLQQSLAKLKKQWPSNSDTLLSIASEVLAKIENA